MNKAIIAKFDRAASIKSSIDEKLERDHKKHLEVLYRMGRNAQGVPTIAIYIGYVDAPKYWDYVEAIKKEYAESLTEIKRTKTTITFAV